MLFTHFVFYMHVCYFFNLVFNFYSKQKIIIARILKNYTFSLSAQTALHVFRRSSRATGKFWSRVQLVYNRLVRRGFLVVRPCAVHRSAVHFHSEIYARARFDPRLLSPSSGVQSTTLFSTSRVSGRLALVTIFIPPCTRARELLSANRTGILWRAAVYAG